MEESDIKRASSHPPRIKNPLAHSIRTFFTYFFNLCKPTFKTQLQRIYLFSFSSTKSAFTPPKKAKTKSSSENKSENASHCTSVTFLRHENLIDASQSRLIYLYSYAISWVRLSKQRGTHWWSNQSYQEKCFFKC